MDYEDNCFDIVVDKGTYDALACDEKDKTMIRNLFREMLRVTKKGGAVAIITNGIPQKRLKDFEEFSEGFDTKLEYSKVELSRMSQIINIMRSKFKDKPLTHIMKDPEMLQYCMKELARIEKIKKEDELYANPKTKMFGMLLKAKRLKEEEAAEKDKEEVPAKRQEFCMLYVIFKN